MDCYTTYLQKDTFLKEDILFSKNGHLSAAIFFGIHQTCIELQVTSEAIMYDPIKIWPIEHLKMTIRTSILNWHNERGWNHSDSVPMFWFVKSVSLFFQQLSIKYLYGWEDGYPQSLKKLSFHPPTFTERNGRYLSKATASFFSSLLLDICPYHFIWWKLVDKNSIFLTSLGTTAITYSNVSSITDGKKDLQT